MVNTLVMLAQAETLNPGQRSVREHFQEGGSLGAVALVIFCVLMGVFLAAVLTALARSGRKTVQSNDPRRLYRDLLQRLSLSTPQRRVLTRLVREAQLEHPAAILLSPKLLDECTARWESGGRWVTKDLQDLQQARTVLFPGSTSTGP